MRSTYIQSPHNPKVKAWANLLIKKGREQQQKFIVEGIHLVKEALQMNTTRFEIDCVLYDQQMGWPFELNEAWEQCIQKPARIEVSEAVIRKCSETKTPQPILAVINMPDSLSEEEALSALLHKQAALVLLLDRLQDPGNVGTLIRSAEAAGADGVLVGAGSADLYHPKTIRSTMGSIFRVPVWQKALRPLVEHLQQVNRPVYASVLDGQSRTCYEVDWRPGGWLIIGSEANGVSHELQELAPTHVHIPMAGDAESLNAAMAGTVFLYEAYRQRSKSR